MVKFKAVGKTGALVGFGLTAENLKFLQDKHVLRIDLAELGIDGNLNVILFYGEDEKELYREIKKAGLIGPDTKLEGMDVVKKQTWE